MGLFAQLIYNELFVFTGPETDERITVAVCMYVWTVQGLDSKFVLLMRNLISLNDSDDYTKKNRLCSALDNSSA
jgi:hypothetical protein